MVTIIIYGLDDFVVGRISRELTSAIAKVYEIDEDEINFIAPNNMAFHLGVEQTSWNILMHVHAPEKFNNVQDEVADLLLDGIGDLAINKTVEFYYYCEENRYTRMNEDYPRYISGDNVVDFENEDYEDKEEGEGEDDIYTGDIFDEVAKRHDK